MLCAYLYIQVTPKFIVLSHIILPTPLVIFPSFKIHIHSDNMYKTKFTTIILDSK